MFIAHVSRCKQIITLIMFDQHSTTCVVSFKLNCKVVVLIHVTQK